MTNVLKLRNASFDTRKNLPGKFSTRTGESRFLAKFEQAYFKQDQRQAIRSTEFGMQEFGRADLVWIAWNPVALAEEFSALALQKQLLRYKLTSFEAKLTNWRKGLQQAFRYRYFADKSILVMPESSISAALANIEEFKDLNVGLWGFDPAAHKISQYVSPNKARAISKEAREEAISLITSKIDLRKIRKHLDSIM